MLLKNGILIIITKQIHDLLVSKNLENNCDQIACYIMENMLSNIKIVYLLRGQISNFPYCFMPFLSCAFILYLHIYSICVS